jgi:hypothetical protein
MHPRTENEEAGAVAGGALKVGLVGNCPTTGMWPLYSGDEKTPVYFHGANLSRAAYTLAARLGTPLLGTDMANLRKNLHALSSFFTKAQWNFRVAYSSATLHIGDH